jgi:hypothetical protein
MGKTRRFIRGVLLLAAIAGVSGCVTSKVLTLPGDLARPGQKGAVRGTGEPKVVAVLDFAFAGDPSREIGRDFDLARPIVWKGDPGKAVPDLVADVLNESGVRAVRVSSDAAVPGNAVAKVWGSVDRFRVDARKTGSMKAKVEYAASVSVTVYGSGGNAPPGWNSVVASENWTTEPLFVTPEGARDALKDAANAVAEEVVRRLAAAGVILLPPAPAGLPGGEPPAGVVEERK